jgi:uncharacterized protein YkwD
MRARARVSALALGLVAAFCASAAVAGPLEDDVLDELNFARTRPMEYARSVLRAPASYDRYERRGGPGDEDPAAFDEAIDFLMSQRPLPPLKRDPRLASAARDHAAGQGPRGGLGHGGPAGEGPGRRMQQHGIWAGLSAENISYGYREPRDVVLQLIIDSGVPGRGHRKNIFGRSYQAAGVACGGHRTYGAMCVIDFAGAIVER